MVSKAALRLLRSRATNRGLLLIRRPRLDLLVLLGPALSHDFVITIAPLRDFGG
jgi:hypothetical protein